MSHDRAVLEEGRGPAVLMIHGFPFGAWMWNPQVDALMARFRCIAPDLRGFGDSRLPGPTAKIEDYADDMALVLKERGIEKCALMGLSMGGYVALAFVERYPEMVAALILADTKAGPDSEEAKRTRTQMADRARREGGKYVAATLAPKLFSAQTLAQNPTLVEIVRANMAKASPSAIVAALGAMRDRPDRRSVLAHVRVPTLLIVGAEDTITPVPEAEAMKASLPHATLAVIEGAGHLSNMEAPEQFNGALLPFLDAVLAGVAHVAVARSIEQDGLGDLADRRCVPCSGNVPPLKGADIAKWHKRLGNDWKVVDEHHLERQFRFNDFGAALVFVNAIGSVAEDQKHHPDIHLSYGKVKVQIWTHKIDGLTDSDFILAAKIDRVFSLTP